MRRITVKAHQSIMDISLQEYGSVEAVQWIVEDNPGTVDSIVDNLETGQEIWIRNSVVNRTTQQNLSKILINTMDTNSLADGIGFEGIERQLKVY